MRCLGIHVGADACVEFAVVVEDTQDVFAHLLPGKEFGAVSAKLRPNCTPLPCTSAPSSKYA